MGANAVSSHAPGYSEKGFLIVKGCERRSQVWTGSIRSRRLFEWLSLAASQRRRARFRSRAQRRHNSHSGP
jgi:hypothetical protein